MSRWKHVIYALIAIAAFYAVNRTDVANCDVALVALASAYVFLQALETRSRVATIVFGAGWLLLLPNTAYIFTDVMHAAYLFRHADGASGQAIVVARYALLELFAAASFLFASYPIEKIIERSAFLRRHAAPWLAAFSLIVGFGVVLGRFGHINSYVVFTEPWRIAATIGRILGSGYLIGMIALFGSISAALYIALRPLLMKAMRHAVLPPYALPSPEPPAGPSDPAR